MLGSIEYLGRGCLMLRKFNFKVALLACGLVFSAVASQANDMRGGMDAYSLYGGNQVAYNKRDDRKSEEFKWYGAYIGINGGYAMPFSKDAEDSDRPDRRGGSVSAVLDLYGKLSEHLIIGVSMHAGVELRDQDANLPFLDRQKMLTSSLGIVFGVNVNRFMLFVMPGLDLHKTAFVKGQTTEWGVIPNVGASIATGINIGISQNLRLQLLYKYNAFAFYEFIGNYDDGKDLIQGHKFSVGLTYRL